MMFQLLLFSQLMSLTLGNKWSVEYSQLNLCALKGSTVIMNVTYTHPPGLTVTKRFWVINPVKGKEPTDLYNEPGYSGRVTYLTHVQNHFPLRLSDVKNTDERLYCVRVLGKKSTDNYLFFPGVTLTVTELRVETPENVVEGNHTVLVCNTTCSLSDTPTFIWYKNNHIIDTKNNINTLILQTTKADDAGRYDCAVRGYEHLRSPARTLSVKYRPKNVSVSISPSGDIVENSPVTLTCKSDANPLLQNYTWFKGMTSVGKEKTYNISKISSEDSGEYKCKCSNEVGHQYSNSVTLKVVGQQSKVQSTAIAVVILCLSIISLVLTVVFLRKKKMYCWSEEHTGQHDNLSVQSAAPQSNSRLVNEDEDQYANIAYPRKVLNSAVSSTVQVHDKEVKNHQEEDVLYTTVNISSSHRLQWDPQHWKALAYRKRENDHIMIQYKIISSSVRLEETDQLLSPVVSSSAFKPNTSILNLSILTGRSFQSRTLNVLWINCPLMYNTRIQNFILIG
ncbi:B-cell receptor CD22-like isoform X2 [Tachysurus ichikawai]